MENDMTLDEAVDRLQKNLASIRKMLGWSMEKTAGKMRVTKQTVSNIESGKVRMSFAQYVLIRLLINRELETEKKDDVFAQIINVLLDGEKEAGQPDWLNKFL